MTKGKDESSHPGGVSQPDDSGLSPRANNARDRKAQQPGVPDAYAITGRFEPGTQVFTFAIITVGVMDGADLGTVDKEDYC